MNHATADLYDHFADRVRVVTPIFRSFGGVEQFHGPIETVQVYRDNVLVRRALESVAEGTVLVVDGGGSLWCALLGDKLAGIAVERKLAGIVVHGCVRDSRELAAMKLGVLALATNPRKSLKRGQGVSGESLAFADVVWKPGDYLYADEDGILLSDGALHTS